MGCCSDLGYFAASRLYAAWWLERREQGANRIHMIFRILRFANA